MRRIRGVGHHDLSSLQIRTGAWHEQQMFTSRSPTLRSKARSQCVHSTPVRSRQRPDSITNEDGSGRSHFRNTRMHIASRSIGKTKWSSTMIVVAKMPGYKHCGNGRQIEPLKAPVSRGYGMVGAGGTSITSSQSMQFSTTVGTIASDISAGRPGPQQKNRRLVWTTKWLVTKGPGIKNCVGLQELSCRRAVEGLGKR